MLLQSPIAGDVRGRLHKSERVGTPPHPDPLHSPSKTGVNALMASGEREQTRRDTCDCPAPQAESREEATVWSQEQALVEILRGRLEGLGPMTQTGLAVQLGLESEAIRSALTALEVEGSVLRGR